MSGSNSYAGSTTINGGLLVFGTPGSFPFGSPSVTINSGGGLAATGPYPTVNVWLASGAITTSSSGAMVLTPNSNDTAVDFATPGYNGLSLGAVGSVTFGGTINPGPNGYRLGGGSAGTLTLLQALSGNNALNVFGPGEVVLAAQPTYTGPTTLSGGTLDLGGNTLSTTASVSFQGGVLQDGTIVSGSEYNVQGGVVATSLGGNVGLTKSTDGLATLSASNSYTGPTTVVAGTLRADDGAGLPALSNLSLSGGVWEVDPNITRTLGTGAGQLQVVGGASGFSAYGQPATVTLTGTGGTTLTWGDPAFNPSTLVLEGPTANQPLTFSNSIDLNDGASPVARTILVNTNTATITGSLFDSGAAASLVKTGSGVLVLTSSNGYSGSTTIAAGTLQVGNGGSGASIGNTISVLDNGSLVFNHGDGTTFAPAISGSGSLTQTGTGILTLLGSNSYTGSTTIAGGTLQVGNGGSGASIGSTSIVLDNGSLVLNQGDDVEFSALHRRQRQPDPGRPGR